MTLYLIGIGLHDEKDITVRGLEIIRKASRVYLENYTATLCSSNANKETLEKMYGKEVIIADRELVEKGCEKLIEEAKTNDVALLVVGDPMGATTHIDIILRAKEKGVRTEIVHNASILNAVGVVGLELYKYGKTTSIVFPQKDWKVETHYDVIKENKERGLHTLCLLDIKVKEPAKENLRHNKQLFEKPRFMTVNEAVKNLLEIEEKRKEGIFTDETICVGCARIGSDDQKIISGKAKEIALAEFGAPMHCLIVPGKLHFMEEEALRLWKPQ